MNSNNCSYDFPERPVPVMDRSEKIEKPAPCAQESYHLGDLTAECQRCPNPRLEQTAGSFMMFPKLPPEVRDLIWRTAIKGRIVEWYTTAYNHNVFTVLLGSLPLLKTCSTSRRVAFVHGRYHPISSGSSRVYFSPIFDFLLFDEVWLNFTLQL